MPQIQLLLEILDLEEAVFIQYKPSELTWPGPEEFVVTEVTRDRKWFEEKLPIMDELWKKVLFHRANGVDEILNKKQKKQKKKTESSAVVLSSKCEIVNYVEDQPNVFSEE